jgi:hypothetical protein
MKHPVSAPSWQLKATEDTRGRPIGDPSRIAGTASGEALRATAFVVAEATTHKQPSFLRWYVRFPAKQHHRQKPSPRAGSFGFFGLEENVHDFGSDVEGREDRFPCRVSTIDYDCFQSVGRTFDWQVLPGGCAAVRFSL